MDLLRWAADLVAQVEHLLEQKVPAPFLRAFVLDTITQYTTKTLIGQFWSHLTPLPTDETLESGLYQALQCMQSLLDCLESIEMDDIIGLARQCIQGVICSTDNQTHYRHLFQSYVSTVFEKAQPSEDEETPDQTLEHVSDIFRMALHFEPSKDIVAQVIKSKIQEHAKKIGQGEFGESLIAALQEWTNESVLAFLQEHFESLLPEIEPKFEMWVHESILSTRMEDIFYIMIDFPESTPALEDLKQCLQVTRKYRNLVDSARDAFKQRLHTGANTSDILESYLSALKSLTFLDPTGLMRENVTPDVRQYLRDRPDTLRCIISAMTNESGNSQLVQELENADEVAKDTETEYADGDSEDDDATWHQWKPDPLTTHHISSTIVGEDDGVTQHDKSLDLLNSLFTKEQFVQEYAGMLGERLLDVVDFEVDKELRNLELLKIRFGDVALNQCQIMLSDMANSKRINAYVLPMLGAQLKTESPLISVTLLSHLFWPTQKYEKVGLPPTIKNQLDIFGKEYEKHKGSRKLEFHESMGTVELDLEILNVDGELTERTFSVTPAQASVLFPFESKASWTLDDVSRELGTSETVVRRHLQFWATNGVVREVRRGHYVLSSSLSETELVQDDNEPLAEDKEEENLDNLEPFIIALLKTMGTMSVSKVHQSLASAMGLDCTITQLGALLTKMAKAERIDQTPNGAFAFRK